MTTYDNNLALKEQKGLPELYKLTFGSTVERYTSWPVSVTFEGSVYQTVPIKRSGISLDNQYKNVTCTIAAPCTPAFQRYLVSAPAAVTQVTIYQAVEDDLSEYVIIFSGNIKSVSFPGKFQCQAECVSNSSILDNVVPGILYQSYCNWTVFDDDCGLDATAWRITCLGVTFGEDSNGHYAQHANLIGKAATYFQLGVISDLTEDSMRMITNYDNSNGRIHLHVPFGTAELVTGDDVYVYPGCTGSPYICKNRFHNLAKFMGMPYIPSNNPAVWGFCKPKKVY